MSTRDGADGERAANSWWGSHCPGVVAYRYSQGITVVHCILANLLHCLCLHRVINK